MTIKCHVISKNRHLWVLQFRLNAINIHHNNGPKMLPCGTPKAIFTGGDNALTHIVCWTRPERCERNHSKLFPATPSDLSLLMGSRWSTVSNALRRSRNTVLVTHPLSILSRTWSVKVIKAVEVERFSRKPNCDCDNNLFSSGKELNWICADLSMILLIVGKIDIGR